tara:strand:- start:824 stop:967 length:144 start_codon:yes stop_codon:yes gene_type:complete
MGSSFWREFFKGGHNQDDSGIFSVVMGSSFWCEFFKGGHNQCGIKLS